MWTHAYDASHSAAQRFSAGETLLSRGAGRVHQLRVRRPQCRNQESRRTRARAVWRPVIVGDLCAVAAPGPGRPAGQACHHQACRCSTCKALLPASLRSRGPVHAGLLWVRPPCTALSRLLLWPHIRMRGLPARCGALCGRLGLQLLARGRLEPWLHLPAPPLHTAGRVGCPPQRQVIGQAKDVPGRSGALQKRQWGAWRARGAAIRSCRPGRFEQRTDRCRQQAALSRAGA